MRKCEPVRRNWQLTKIACCSPGRKGLTDSYHSVKHKHSYSHLTAVLIRGTNRVRQMRFSQAVRVMVPSCPDKVRPLGRMFHSEENTGRTGDYCVIIPNSSQMKMTVWRVEEQTTDWGRARGAAGTHTCSNTTSELKFILSVKERRGSLLEMCLMFVREKRLVI